MERKTQKETKIDHESLLSTLVKKMEDRYLKQGQHTENLLKSARELASNLSLPEHQLEEIALLAHLHDIGKVSVPDEILKKTSALTSEEWELMEQHPEVGYHIARSINSLASIADAVLSHHERWDGSGYPRGLKGETIPMLSRILAIADAYDVMVNGRQYKPAMTRQEALDEIKRCAGTQFDPTLVDLFIKIITRQEPA